MQKMPAPLKFVEPMECKAVPWLPEGDDWWYELKLDGYRAIAIKQQGEVMLYSRNGNVFNSKFPRIVEALEQLRAKRFILDGELVAIDEQGRHSFSLLQNIKTSRAPVHLYLFDLLHIDEENLMDLPLAKRRIRLEQEFRKLPPVLHLSPILDAHLDVLLQNVRELELEGVVAKNRSSLYLPGKAPGTWQKHKTQRTDDFLIGGYIPGNHHIDELVVGEFRDKMLFYVESVKNGFVPATRRQVYEAIKQLQTNQCPFVNLPEKKGGHRMDRQKIAEVRWVKPKVICELAFNERTVRGHLRHARFLRLRDDTRVVR